MHTSAELFQWVFVGGHVRGVIGIRIGHHQLDGVGGPSFSDAISLKLHC